VLNFALTLENLEFEFYRQALDKLSAQDLRRAGIQAASEVRLTLKDILSHERTHADTLTQAIQALGGKPVPACQYNFDFSSVKVFLKVARALEKTGVSAYVGALNILSDKGLMVIYFLVHIILCLHFLFQRAGASIATIEGRHAAFLNGLDVKDPAPHVFDQALTPSSVLTLASPFIKKCDFDLSFGLGVKQFKVIKISNGIGKAGGELFVSKDVTGGHAKACQFLLNNSVKVSPLANQRCVIPNDIKGDVYFVLTNSMTPLTEQNEDIIVAGPAIIDVEGLNTIQGM
jgi:hypothetical protein